MHSSYNKVFVKYQAQGGGGLTPTPLAYALDLSGRAGSEKRGSHFE